MSRALEPVKQIGTRSTAPVHDGKCGANARHATIVGNRGEPSGESRLKGIQDRYIRRLLVIGMTSQLQSARRKPEAHPWVTGLLANGKPNKLVAVAMANKAARIAWVIMTRGEVYRARQPATEGTALTT